MKKATWVGWLVVIDWAFATISWFLFYYFRAAWVEHKPFIATDKFYLGITMVPLCFVLFYYLQGTYLEVKRLYRLKIAQLTFWASAIGSLLLFFVLLLDDFVLSYRDYYLSFSILFLIQLFLSLSSRIFFVTLMISQLRKPGNGFTTIIIGGSEKAIKIVKEIRAQKNNVNHILGYVNVNGNDRLLDGEVPYFGHVSDLEEILRNHPVEEIVIAIESTDHDRLQKIISRIYNAKIILKVLPDTYELLTGALKMTNIYGTLLIAFNRDEMPLWQHALKRFIDISLSLVAIFFLLPVYLISAIMVKVTSQGPIFFLQERIGMNNRPFQIIKFRTMYVNSEANGPQLSSSNDPRITKVGRFMRKTRLDEFPQFINVILGHMSLVGPRPERQYYIDQIIAVEPQYLLLNTVRPGITSWGQVKYGYAENVEQMLDRMKYDLLYLNNRSIALDLKILFYTVAIVLKAKGK